MTKWMLQDYHYGASMCCLSLIAVDSIHIHDILSYYYNSMAPYQFNVAVVITLRVS